MKDREDEKENLVNKNQKLLKALEAITSIGIYLFFCFIYFYTHKNPIKIVQLHACLIIHSKTNFAPLAGLEMRVTQVFLLLFRKSFFFVYRHSDLEGLFVFEWDVNMACESHWCVA
jgi:hypothetical protein